jgi:hypothetical protein
MATPVAPTAVADTATIKQNVTTAVNVKANDTAGTDATPTTVSLTSAAVTFAPTGQPSGVVISNNNLRATKEGVGVWAIDSNLVHFTPEPKFVGVADAVKYIVTDSQPLASNAATVTITVTAATDLASATRTYGVSADGQRYVDVVLDEEISANEPVSADSIGLSNIDPDNVWVKAPAASGLLFPNSHSPAVYPTSTIANGSTVRFYGA